MATITVAGVTSPVSFTVDPSGRIMSVRLLRWGNPPPDPNQFRMVDFGSIIEAERTFSSYTIPTRVRVGWHFGSPEFERVGEFFRATVDDAIFR